MDKIEGSSLHSDKNVEINPHLKLSNKTTSSSVTSSKATATDNKLISDSIKQRNVSIIDHEFSKLSFTSLESYKNIVNLLTEEIKKTSKNLINDVDACRLAHTMLQLNLPKKQEYAKKILIDIEKDGEKKRITSLSQQALSNPIEIAYEFLLPHKILPESYLNNCVYKYLADTWLANCDDDEKSKLAMVQQYAKTVGIKQAKDFNFKRMLKLKNILNKYHPLETIEKDKPDTTLNITHSDQKKIQISPPDNSKYHLDEIDKKFIAKLITEEKYFKIKKFDILNRIKRKLLHSKRHISQISLSCVVVAMVSSTFTFGISLFSLGFGIAWTFFLHGVIAVYKFAKVVNSRKIIQEQKLLTDDIKNISADNKKDLKKFINACSYVCSYDCMDNLLHAFSEFEKITETLKANKSKENSIESVEYENIYKLRKQDLHDSLITFSETSSKILEKLNPEIHLINSNLNKIWDTKFAHLTTIQQQSIFTKVIAQPHLKKYSHKLYSTNNNWIKKILPFLADNPNNKAIAEVVEKELTKIMDTTKKNNNKSEEVFTKAKSGFDFFKGLNVSFSISRIKIAVFYAVRNLAKAGSFSKNYLSALAQEIKNPINYAIDWVEIIVFTLLAIVVEDMNTRINNRRLKRNKAGEKLTTGLITTRDQTEREELFLFKIASEKKLSGLTKKILDFVEEHEELNKKILEIPNIEDMPDEQAAEIFIKYLSLKQDLTDNLGNAFGDFYNQVAMKTEYIEREMHPYDMQEF